MLKKLFPTCSLSIAMLAFFFSALVNAEDVALPQGGTAKQIEATIVSERQKVSKVAFGGAGVVFLKEDGSLWQVNLHAKKGSLSEPFSAGQGTYFKLLMTNVSDVSVGYGVLAVKKNGELWGWGFSDDNFGIVADKVNLIMENVAAAQFSHGDGLLILLRDKTLWAWNINPCPETHGASDEPIQLLSDIVNFSGEGSIVLAVDTKNKLWGWGQNDFGRLLPVAQEVVCSPKLLRTGVVSASANQFETLYVKKNGTLMRQGINETLLLSDEAWNQDLPSPLHAMQAKKVKDVKGDKPYSFRSVDDKLWTRFYSEPFAECIDKTKTIGKDATQVKIDKNLETVTHDYYLDHKGITFLVSENVADYAIQESAMFVVKKDGTLWGCGRNSNGELGLGDTEPRRQFTQIHLPPTPENAKGVFDQ